MRLKISFNCPFFYRSSELYKNTVWVIKLLFFIYIIGCWMDLFDYLLTWNFFIVLIHRCMQKYQNSNISHWYSHPENCCFLFFIPCSQNTYYREQFVSKYGSSPKNFFYCSFHVLCILKTIWQTLKCFALLGCLYIIIIYRIGCQQVYTTFTMFTQ